MTVRQIGLIVGLVSLAIVIVLIIGAVGMGYLTVKNRSRPPLASAQQESVNPGHRPRQKSMIEEIQLVAEITETDMVDGGGIICYD